MVDLAPEVTSTAIFYTDSCPSIEPHTIKSRSKIKNLEMPIFRVLMLSTKPLFCLQHQTLDPRP